MSLKLAPGVEDSVWLRVELDWAAEEGKQFPIINSFIRWINETKAWGISSPQIKEEETEVKNKIRGKSAKRKREKALYVAYHKIAHSSISIYGAWIYRSME